MDTKKNTHISQVTDIETNCLDTCWWLGAFLFFSFLVFSTLSKPSLTFCQERYPVLSYTEVLLVPLTTPDFSMPYNVITITCTIFALYFRSLLNALRRRVGEEERILKSNAKKAGPLTLMLSKIYAKLRGKQWEPPQSSLTSKRSNTKYKLIAKVVLVAGLAVAWQYHSE